MADIARAAGVAKGTPYLYWSSKEGLFLDALAAEYGQFTRAVVTALAALVDPTEAEVGRVLVEHAYARPQLMTLIGLLHSVLEHNADVGQVIAIKAQMLAGGLEVGAALQRVFPWLSPDRSRRILLMVHGAMVSFHRMSDAPAAVRLALEDPELSPLRIDAAAEMAQLVRDLLVAARVDAAG